MENSNFNPNNETLYTLDTDFGSYTVRLRKSTYVENNSLAIIVDSWDDEFEFWEQFCIITVNLSNGMATDTRAFIDTNNCPFAEKFLVDNNIASPTGRVAQSGWCTYPLYQFKEDVLNKIVEEK